MNFTILGCGSSGGVPQIGGDWGDCDPNNEKNRRQRCSLRIEQIRPTGTTSILVDTSPDLQSQMLDAEVAVLDAVVVTHEHADHIHGFDDLRPLAQNSRVALDVWASVQTGRELCRRFGYAFDDSNICYPPFAKLRTIEGNIFVEGKGGTVTLEPILVEHGSIDALGFRVGNFAYVPDVSEIYPISFSKLKDLDLLVIDALQRKPHRSHSHLAKTLSWIEKLHPVRSVLTNMHIDMDFDQLLAELPPGVEPAYDGLAFSFSSKA